LKFEIIESNERKHFTITEEEEEGTMNQSLSCCIVFVVAALHSNKEHSDKTRQDKTPYSGNFDFFAQILFD